MPIRVLVNTPAVQPLVVPIPVILVPGIMGSKVTFTDFAEWDPDDAVYMAKAWIGATPSVVRKRLARGTSPASDGVIGLDKLGAKNEPKLRGFLSVNKEYVDFLTVIQSYLEKNARMPVYALGYDWTKSNFKSAARIADLVDKVLALYPGSTQVIIITHSNGGLVVRAACKLNGLEKKVLAVIHGANPRYGSPFGYARCFFGADEYPTPLGYDTAGWGFAQIAGITWWEWLTKLACIPTACQLLPWSKYRAYDRDEELKAGSVPGAKGKAWLSLDGKHVDTSDPFAMYQQSGFPGICFDWPDPKLPADDDNPRGSYGKLRASFQKGKEEWAEVIVSLKANLVEAKSFESQVGSYLHPNTYWVVGTGIPTPSAVLASTSKAVPSKIVKDKTGKTTTYTQVPGLWLGTIREAGDATVGGQVAGGGIADSSKGHFLYRGSAFDHQKILNAPEVQNEILSMLTKIVPGRIEWPPPPPVPPPRLPPSDSQGSVVGTGDDTE